MSGGAKSFPRSLRCFIGTSKAMLEVYNKIEKVSDSETSILITGATGTGKDVCANALHQKSPRNNHPFIVVNCAALSASQIDSALFGHTKGAYTGADKSRDGAIKKANNGTLFLDEIGDMPLSLQTKLLRFTEDFLVQPLGADHSFQSNVRLIYATNQDLKYEVEKGNFREDLYYRLNQFEIHMPSLKNRQSDIICLINFYIEKYAAELKCYTPTLCETTKVFLENYAWPGNIRELQNLVRYFLLENSKEIITPDVLPDKFRKITYKKEAAFKPVHIPLKQIEKNAIEGAIAFCQGNIVKAADMLDVAPSTIYRKIQNWKDSNLS